jgi:uncharacterized damage-inducible protein DinB
MEKNKDLVERLEKKVEEHIQISVEIFQNLDSSEILQPSSSGGWSIAECLDHLNSYGNFYLPKIRTGLQRSKITSKEHYFQSGLLGRYFTNMMSIHSGKKYKAIKKHLPQKELEAAAVVAEFINQQEIYLELLEKSKNADLNKIKIKTSLSAFVKLKLGDVFQFLIAHNERHLKQAKDNQPQTVNLNSFTKP